MVLVREFLAKNKTAIIPQPPYSLVLAPADIFLLPKLKPPMKGKRFATLEELKKILKQGPVGHTKKRVSEVFRGLEKNAGIRV